MLVLIIVLAVVAVLALAVTVIALQRAREAAQAARRPETTAPDLAAVEAEARRILLDAETRQKEALLEAKEEAIRLRTQAEVEIRERTAELQKQERRIAQKEENLERRAEAFERRERQLAQREQELEEARARLEQLRQQRLQEIERIAGLTASEARDLLLAEVEREVREDANRRLHQIEAEYAEQAQRRAREIVATALQRITADVTLSGFDPIRREVARIALTHLVQDGRIHPTRIEEVVEKAKIEVEASLKSTGETAAVEAGVPSLHPELHKLLGRLRYRLSHGQNLLKHSQETAEIGALLASELGADVSVVRRAGLLHDIGKAIDHEVEGSHAQIGAEMARRYGQPAAVVHAIEAHCDEVPPRTIEAILVQVADALSIARPGARREALEHYIKRLEELERLAESFAGVEKAYAIQAGREVRVIVRPEEIDDLGAMRLARDISRKIEESMEYAGQIKVTVVRETRTTEIAR